MWIYKGSHKYKYMQLELKSPLKVFKVTQKFGNINPVLYGNAGHNGIDLYAKHGTPVYASHDGFANYQVDGAGGHGVIIITDKEYNHDGGQAFFKTVYWHLVDPLKEPKYKSPIADKTGFVPVKCGDIIGYADNTGKSTGSHLHYGLKPVAKGENWGVWYNVEQNNGYFGAIDPEPYLPKVSIGNFLFKKTMQGGDKNNDVVQLQKALTKLGYLNDVIDGVYGQKTKVAVLAFQVAYKVISSPLDSYFGYYCGPKTIKKLNSLNE